MYCAEIKTCIQLWREERGGGGVHLLVVLELTSQLLVLPPRSANDLFGQALRTHQQGAVRRPRDPEGRCLRARDVAPHLQTSPAWIGNGKLLTY